MIKVTEKWMDNDTKLSSRETALVTRVHGKVTIGKILSTKNYTDEYYWTNVFDTYREFNPWITIEGAELMAIEMVKRINKDLENHYNDPMTSMS